MPSADHCGNRPRKGAPAEPWDGVPSGTGTAWNMRLRNEQYDYEMTPLCFLAGRDVTLSLRAVNDGKALEPGHEYMVDINENALAEDSRFEGSGCTRRVSVKASDDGILRIRNTFPREGMYQINVMYSGEESRIGHFRVYALEEDMKGLYPPSGVISMSTAYVQTPTRIPLRS